MRRLAAAVVLGLVATATMPAAAGLWPGDAEQAMKGLESELADTRRRAAERLVDAPRAVALRALPRLLGDGDRDVRTIGARLLMRLRSKRHAEKVIPWLNEADHGSRRLAAQVLTLLPVRAAVGPLGRVLSDTDPEVRIAAARALGASGDEGAVAALLGHLDDSSPRVRRAVAGALGRLGSRRATVPLVGNIQDRRADVRVAVLQALGELGDRRAGSALLLALRDADANVRLVAVQVLPRVPAEGRALALERLLATEKADAVRREIHLALGRLGTGKAIAVAIAGLRGNEDERKAASAGLVAAGSAAKAALEACVQREPAQRARDACARILGEIGSSPSASMLAAAVTRGRVAEVAGLAALRRLKSPQALPLALGSLEDADPAVRRAAIATLAVLLTPGHPDGRAVGPLAHALKMADERGDERAALMHLLGRTGSPRAVPPLARLAGPGDDPALRVAAVEALGMLPPAGQDAVLLAAMKAREGRVRAAAAEALARAGSAGAVPALTRSLGSLDAGDRSLTVRALFGPLGRSKQVAPVQALLKQLSGSRGALRELLAETLGRSPLGAASRGLTRTLRGSADPADRRKLAEVLAGRSDGQAVLRRLLNDHRADVRATAAFAVGVGGTAGSAAATRLRHLATKDSSVDVRANALRALRGNAAAGAVACSALNDGHPYVRANAVRLVGDRRAPCLDEALKLLDSDPDPLVRRAVARVLWAQGTALARRMLRSCAAEQGDADVARACARRPVIDASRREPVVVLAVPVGESGAVPERPYALELPDGYLRLGVTDRRGAIFVASTPRGEVRLWTPAALVGLTRR